MHCPECGAEIKEEGKFCPSCGTRIKYAEEVAEAGKRFCPNCGAELNRDDIFCGSCGVKIDEFGAVKHEMPMETRRIQIEGTTPLKETKTKEENSLLVALLVVGLITLFLSFIVPAIGYITLSIVIISAVAVYNDAKTIGAGRGFSKERFSETVTWKQLTWGLSVILLWIIALPFYLVKRKVLLESG